MSQQWSFDIQSEQKQTRAAKGDGRAFINEWRFGGDSDAKGPFVSGFVILDTCSNKPFVTLRDRPPISRQPDVEAILDRLLRQRHHGGVRLVDTVDRS